MSKPVALALKLAGSCHRFCGSGLQTHRKSWAPALPEVVRHWPVARLTTWYSGRRFAMASPA
jgi:hypothetical protein